MQSDRAEAISPQAIHYKAVESLAATHFGLDLKRYPPAQVESLLATLPSAMSIQDDTAIARILSVCSVGETMFMRHPDQFRALMSLVVNGAVGSIDRRLSVWSAGCSTGEEAYSLAALLAGFPAGVRVLGTDVSSRSIERAKLGRYRYWSLRGVDPVSTTSWLDIDAVNAEVRSPFRNLVDFQVQNLMTGPYPENVDIIFCRNVLLYFREDMSATVFQKFYDALRPGGVLFIGYVDPMPSAETPFIECHEGSARYYRKPAAPAQIAIPAVRTLPPPPPDEVLGVTSLPLAPRLPSFRRSDPPPKRLSRASEVPPKSPTTPPSQPPPMDIATRERLNQRLGMARSLCAQGSRDEALELLQSLADDFPLEIEPHVLAAMVADEAGLRDVALAAARRAYFLAPETPIAPFLLGMCLDQVGQRNTAEARYLEARRALESVKDPLAPLAHAEGMTAYQLRRTIDARFQGI
ncbi:MAG TPA: CheR family methyltransferase [Polyangium sp.]|nr:CheR family methyltransferase [Polyangium sp.]